MIEGVIEITADEFFEDGTVFIKLSSDDIPSVSNAFYNFRVNDRSMFEPLPGSGISFSKIDKEGRFNARLPFPYEGSFAFMQLAGNDTLCVLELESVSIDGVQYDLSIRDSIVYVDIDDRYPFIRPDNYSNIYPNPVYGNEFFFEMESDGSESVNAVFVNTSSREIVEIMMPIEDKKLNEYKVELPNQLSSGNYLLYINSRYGITSYLISIRR